jgi:hypothetical protein
MGSFFQILLCPGIPVKFGFPIGQFSEFPHVRSQSLDRVSRLLQQLLGDCILIPLIRHRSS